MRSRDDPFEEQRIAIEASCRRLIADGILEPLTVDEEETRRWMQWELASLAEGHLHLQLDVSRLSEEERLGYECRLSADEHPLLSPHAGYRLPFWLLDGGRRVGTLALGTMYWGRGLVLVSSLYVTPAERRRNIARRALEAVFRAATAHGADGICLDTYWTWQPAVRFYARIGMWVRMWKHNLVFTWQEGLPPYRVDIDGSQARFLLERDGRWHEWITARNLGDRLGWESVELDPRADWFHWHIPGTFALHLALAGWPLVRSKESWERRHHWSDSGEPEGLAYKIEIFEAIYRERGFEIRTPRIPGLRYRDWDEIE